MHLMYSGVGLDVHQTSVGDKAHSDNDTGCFDTTGQPSFRHYISLILTQGNNFKLKDNVFSVSSVEMSRKCMHLPTELSLTMMNNKFLNIMKISIICILQ